MNNKSVNKFIRALASPGLSALTLSLYDVSPTKSNLVLKLVPCIGQDDMGFDKYHKTIFKSTSIDYVAAVNFYPVAAAIIEGKNSGTQVVTQLPCGKGAALTFEYKSEQDGHMGAYLTINKDNQTIPFRFETYKFQFYSNSEDKVVTSVHQVGLKAFAEVLDGYIKSSNTEYSSNTPTVEEHKPEPMPAPVINSSTNTHPGPWSPPRTW